jgi:hypothetical protein
LRIAGLGIVSVATAFALLVLLCAAGAVRPRPREAPDRSRDVALRSPTCKSLPTSPSFFNLGCDVENASSVDCYSIGT